MTPLKFKGYGLTRYILAGLVPPSLSQILRFGVVAALRWLVWLRPLAGPGTQMHVLDIFETPTGPPDPRSPKTPQQQKKKFQKPRKPRSSPKVDARSPKVDAVPQK